MDQVLMSLSVGCFKIAALLFVGLILFNWRRCRRLKLLKKNMPSPFTVVIPDFSGRILPRSEVNPGTFTLRANFSEIKHNKYAILAYGLAPIWSFDEFNEVVFEAWCPDSETPGVFKLAKECIKPPEKWQGNYTPDSLKRQGNILIVYPRIYNKERGVGVLLIGILFLLITLGLGCAWSYEAMFH